MSHARAYFPKLSDTEPHTNLPVICPMVTLEDISRRGLQMSNFRRDLTKKKRLSFYLQNITGLDQHISPYAFRIGGRNWSLAKRID